MAKKLYININSVNKQIKKLYADIGDGVNKKIKKMYAAVDGVYKLIFAEATVWKKYAATSTTTYTEVIKTDGQAAGMTQTNPYTIASKNQYGTYLNMRWATSYTFDSSTGKFTLNNYTEGTYLEAHMAGAITTGSSKYYVQGCTSNNGSRIDTTCVFRVFNGEYASALYFKNKHYATKSTTYSQGAYIEDVESDDPSAYPDNGVHTDGYWYVKQA